eukprot:192844-Pyramimonas_sp.AAC.1
MVEYWKDSRRGKHHCELVFPGRRTQCPPKGPESLTNAALAPRFDLERTRGVIQTLEVGQRVVGVARWPRSPRAVPPQKAAKGHHGHHVVGTA